jgi:hypothetical protein
MDLARRTSDHERLAVDREFGGVKGLGGRWVVVVLMLGALFVAFEARAGDGGPRLAFDASAAALPQDETRAAIERELGRPLARPGERAEGELTIFVDSEHRLVVRYRTPTGSIERFLPMPNEPSDVSLIIALAAGNLVRDPTAGVGPEPREAPPSPAPASRRAEPQVSEPRFPRHLLGLHVAQDVAFVGGSNVCDPSLGQASDHYACFYSGTDDEPFFHTPFPTSDGIAVGPVLATTRLLASYDYAVVPALTVGVRLGYAFRGGPPAGQEPARSGDVSDLNALPAHAKGTGGTPFLPLHAELRAAGWFLPLGEPISAYAGASVGVAQVDAKTIVSQRDCAATLDPSWSPADGSLEDCRAAGRSFDPEALPEVEVDAWKKMGQGFVAVSLGGMVELVAPANLLLNLNAMLMLPASGIVLEPSLGVVTAL